MKSGIIFPSYAAEPVWSAISGGTWSADYPLSNLNSLMIPSRVSRSSTPNAVIAGVFPASRTIQALALVGHNYVSGIHNIRIYGFSGTGTDPVADVATMVYDSGALMWWPSTSAAVQGYRSIRPVVLSSPVTVRSVRVVMLTPSAIELSSIEIGGFWEWPVSPGRGLGFESPAAAVPLIGGAEYQPDAMRTARLYAGAVDLMSMGITGTQGLDFQKQLDIAGAFVFAEDFDDPLTWPRTCLLARNEKLSAMVGRLYRHDAFPISLVEHMR